MGQDERNLYKIDDVLIRTGGIGLLFVLGIAGCFLIASLSGDETDPRDPVLAMIGDNGLIFLGALLCPIVALRTGFSIRSREKRSAAIWKPTASPVSTPTSGSMTTARTATSASASGTMVASTRS